MLSLTDTLVRLEKNFNFLMNVTLNFRSRASYQFRKLKEIHRKFRPLRRAVKLFSYFWIIIKSFLRRLSKKGRILDFDILFPSHAVEKILFFLELIYIVRMCRSVYRLQNSPYFCVFKHARAVKGLKRGWNKEWDSYATLYRFLYWFSEKIRLFYSLRSVRKPLCSA